MKCPASVVLRLFDHRTRHTTHHTSDDRRPLPTSLLNPRARPHQRRCAPLLTHPARHRPTSPASRPGANGYLMSTGFSCLASPRFTCLQIETALQAMWTIGFSRLPFTPAAHRAGVDTRPVLPPKIQTNNNGFIREKPETPRVHGGSSRILVWSWYEHANARVGCV